jgi:hypothetical protein
VSEIRLGVLGTSGEPLAVPEVELASDPKTSPEADEGEAGGEVAPELVPRFNPEGGEDASVEPAGFRSVDFDVDVDASRPSVELKSAGGRAFAFELVPVPVSVAVLLSAASAFGLALPLDGDRKGCREGSAGAGSPTGPDKGGRAGMSRPAELELIEPAPPPFKPVEERFFLSGPPP